MKNILKNAKKMVAVIGFIGCSVSFADIVDENGFVEKWGGTFYEKTLNEQNQITSLHVSRVAEIGSPISKFARTSYFPADLRGMDPLPDDIYASGIVLVWWEGKPKYGYTWSVEFSGKKTNLVIPIENLPEDPVQPQNFSGFEISVDGKYKRIGNLTYGMANFTDQTIDTTWTINWSAPLWEWDHSTSHLLSVKPGEKGNVAIKPNSDNFGVIVNATPQRKSR